MRVLIIGANLCNRGAEAMLLTVISAILSRHPDAEVRAASYAQEDLARVGLTSIDHLHGTESCCYTLIENRKSVVTIAAQLVISITPSRFVRNLIAARFSLTREIQAADAVIDLSGFALSDNRPLWRVAIYWLEAATAYALRTRFMALTQSFGPFKRPLTRTLARSALRRSSLTIARGNQSAHHLESLGLRQGPDFMVSPDITYALDSSPPSAWNDILAETIRPVISIIPNTNIYHRSVGKELDNAYVQLLSNLCKHSALSLNATPVLLCHEIYKRRFDDFDLARLVQNKADSFCKPAIIPATHPAPVLKALIARSDLVIASRFHAMIAALSSATPVLVVSWAHKYRESMEAAGIPNCVIDAACTDACSATAHLDWCWQSRAVLRTRLEASAAKCRDDATQALNALFLALRSATDSGCGQTGSVDK